MARAVATAEAHRVTVAEIRRMTDAANAERLALVQQLLAVEAAMAAGAAPMPPDEAKARERALAKLNGLAPAALQIADGDVHGRAAAIRIELRATDILLAALSQREVTESAAEAYTAAAAHGDTYSQAIRNFVLHIETAQALESWFMEFRQNELHGQTPDKLPLAALVGTPSPIFDLRTRARLTQIREAALAVGLVTAADIRKVQQNG